MSRFFRQLSRRHTKSATPFSSARIFRQLSCRHTEFSTPFSARIFRQLSGRHTDSATPVSATPVSATEISVFVEIAGIPPQLFSVSAATLGSLKKLIMESLSLSKEDLNQRLLVTDDRDFTDITVPAYPILDNCRDLLESKDASSLISLGLKDGDKLRLVWKNPFIIRLLTPTRRLIDRYDTHEIHVMYYDTVGKLKRKIKKATGGQLDNLPDEFFFPGLDKKPILSLGFYCLANCPYEVSGFFTILLRTELRYDEPGFRFEVYSGLSFA